MEKKPHIFCGNDLTSSGALCEGEYTGVEFKVFESETFKKQAGLLTFTPNVSE